jgi:hypothetical protein
MIPVCTRILGKDQVNIHLFAHRTEERQGNTEENTAESKLTLLTAPPTELFNLLYELLGLFVDTSIANFLPKAGKLGARRPPLVT